MRLTTKPNRCRHCRERMPADLARHVLHDDCIAPWLNAQAEKKERARLKKERAAKKVERAVDKQRKAALEPLRELLSKAQTSFNAWVRERDAEQPCISCGVTNPPMKPGGQWDAGHFLSRGAYPELRFDEDNCHKQCKSCNGGGGKFAHKARTVAEQYETRLIERIGAERVDRLKGPHDLVKWDRDTLRQIAVIYRAKLRQLKKEQA